MNSDSPDHDATRPVRLVFSIVGDKWTPVVLYLLAQGPKRFGELQRETAGISKKMLTQVLRTLERRSLVDRQVFAEVPPHTEYSLTEKGRLFHEPISALCEWAQENMELLESILEIDAED
ncbi:MAG TPA: transcriptional regulator [Planctomycetaceae bacterium]|nr:transcriptional regulator [Planctomycetaceae bacterium]